MQAWHRSPGNGYNRSSPVSMSMGIAASSRVSPSPESSLRSQTFYASSKYRSFNRGNFGSARNPHPKSFQFQTPPTPTTPLPQKPDIFLEAGRLAAEYLVSQELLPPTVLSSGPRWQNGNNLQDPQVGRTSAHSLLGNEVSYTSSGRRRFNVDELGNSGSRAHLKGRRRSGSSYKGHGSDWGRDYVGSSSSFLDSTNFKASLENDNKIEDDHSASGNRYEQVLGSDVVNREQKSKTEDADKVVFDMDVVMDSKSSSSDTEKDSLPETKDKETAKSSDDLRNLIAGTEEVKDNDRPSSVSIYENEKPSVDEELPVSVEAAKNDSFGNNATDLVSLCKFSMVSTRTRSSLTYKRSKVDHSPTTQVEKASVFAPQGETEGLVGDDSIGNSVNGVVVDKTDDSKLAETEILKTHAVLSAEYVGVLGHDNNLEQVDSARSPSFSHRTFGCDGEPVSSQGPLIVESGSTLHEDRGDKRALELEENDGQNGAKKPRVCLPQMDVEANESYYLTNVHEKKNKYVSSSCETSVVAVGCESAMMNDSELLKVGGQQYVNFAEEKQIFSNSFTTCDLNLMEVSKMHESHDSDPNMSNPALLEVKTEATPIDIDLSITNSIVPVENSGRAVHDKAIKVIDLETDYAEEDKSLTMVERKTETAYNGLEGFPNHTQNTGDIPDGYGLMISELLGNDFPSCSSLPEDINSIHNGIDLHDGVVTLGDDDSIYMSLGEIPLTFLRSWEQTPTQQEYDKSF